MSVLMGSNRLLMVLEDFLFPDLLKIADEFFTQPNKLVFVTGHQRSGTTNVHKALSSLEGVTTGTMFDLAFPSLIMKYMFGGMTYFVNIIFFRNFV